MSSHDSLYVKQKVREHWNARAPMLDVPPFHVAKTAEEHALWLDLLTRHFPAGGRLRVLDIGTGLAYLAGAAAELGHEAYGIDIAEEMIARAQARIAGLGLAVDLRVADADRLPFADGWFDVITERNVLWTMPEPSVTLAEFTRVLRPGGRLLSIESHWLDRPSDPVESAMGGAPNLDEHYREFRAAMPLMGGATPAAMTDVLASGGFAVIATDAMEAIYEARVKYFPDTALPPERRIYLLCAERPMTGQGADLN